MRVVDIWDSEAGLDQVTVKSVTSTRHNHTHNQIADQFHEAFSVWFWADRRLFVPAATARLLRLLHVRRHGILYLGPF